LRKPITDGSLSLPGDELEVAHQLDIVFDAPQLLAPLVDDGGEHLGEPGLAQTVGTESTWVSQFGGTYVYFLILLPILGNLVSGGKRNAYGYLPRSVLAFPDRDELKRIVAECGLLDVQVHSRTFGIVTVHVGTRPEEWPA